MFQFLFSVLATTDSFIFIYFPKKISFSLKKL
jgi:hypothetical protein